jgi:Asp-tRNA(Asn)/Glu-tRNA(Gln) amidotransferase A subunit family amidase
VTELVEQSLTRMIVALGNRDISAVELFEAHADRIAERDAEINAPVLPRLEEAREEAVAADAALARGDEVLALHGIPFTAKDPLPVRGMRAEGSGLPVGVQLIGARGSERTPLSLASELESAGAAGWLAPAA